MIKFTQIIIRYLLVSIIGFLVITLNGCATTDISLLPMYGDAEKTENQKQADAAYIEQMEVKFKTRRTASNSAAKEGWYYWRTRDWQTAMRRFNQSWLLDPDNHLAYWGYLVILAAQGKYTDASDMGDKALSLAPDNHRLLCDVAFTYGNHANLIVFSGKEKEELFQKAFSAYTKASIIKPNQICQNWAITLFQNGQYLEAWEKVKKSEELGHRYREVFLKDLSREIPRPE